MYKIMTIRSHRNNNKSLYQWHSVIDSNNNKVQYETNDLNVLSNKIEEMLRTTPSDNILIVDDGEFTIDVSTESEIISIISDISDESLGNASFRIFIVKSHRANLETLYNWYLTDDGLIYQTDDLNELADEVELLLRKYSVDDILIVNVGKFTLEALINNDSFCSHDTLTSEELIAMYTSIKNEIYNE